MKNLIAIILGFALAVSAQAQSIKYNIFTTNTPAGFTNGPGLTITTNGGVFGFSLNISNNVGVSFSTNAGKISFAADIVGAGMTTVLTNGNQLIISNSASAGTTLTNASTNGVQLINPTTNNILTVSTTNGISAFTNASGVVIGFTNSGTVVQRKIVSTTNRTTFTSSSFPVGLTTNASSTAGFGVLTNTFTATSTNNRLRMFVTTYVASSAARGIVAIIGGNTAGSAVITTYIGQTSGAAAAMPCAISADIPVEATSAVNYRFAVANDASDGVTIAINRRSDTDTSFGGTPKVVFMIEEYIP